MNELEIGMVVSSEELEKIRKFLTDIAGTPIKKSNSHFCLNVKWAPSESPSTDKSQLQPVFDEDGLLCITIIDDLGLRNVWGDIGEPNPNQKRI